MSSPNLIETLGEARILRRVRKNLVFLGVLGNYVPDFLLCRLVGSETRW